MRLRLSYRSRISVSKTAVSRWVERIVIGDPFLGAGICSHKNAASASDEPDDADLPHVYLRRPLRVTVGDARARPKFYRVGFVHDRHAVTASLGFISMLLGSNARALAFGRYSQCAFYGPRGDRGLRRVMVQATIPAAS
jgi:hypothetical protein